MKQTKAYLPASIGIRVTCLIAPSITAVATPPSKSTGGRPWGSSSLVTNLRTSENFTPGRTGRMTAWCSSLPVFSNVMTLSPAFRPLVSNGPRDRGLDHGQGLLNSASEPFSSVTVNSAVAPFSAPT